MVAPKRDSRLEKIAAEATWRISTAVAVDGIMRLYSSNPKRDANLMREGDAHTRNVLLEGPKDKSPLRSAYIEGNDAVIFKMVLNYLKAHRSERSFQLLHQLGYLYHPPCHRTYWRRLRPHPKVHLRSNR